MKLLLLVLLAQEVPPLCWSGRDIEGKDVFIPCHVQKQKADIAALQAEVKLLKQQVRFLMNYVQAWESHKAKARKQLEEMKVKP